MNKLLFFLFPLQLWSQSFPGAPGTSGSTAIPKDSSCFVSWATGINVQRGYIDINDTTQTYDNSNRASFGVPENALGPAEGDLTSVVSIGDHGTVVLTFDQPITNGPGFDFAIFENGFQDNYIELGFVAVSSDGIYFQEFPSVSETPTDVQAWNGSSIDCRYLNNLAGKYRAGYGTPFDLNDLPVDPLVNKNAITHIRITDVVGSIGTGGTDDSQGHRINDPYPTPFASCGFDLDAVGIINQTLGMPEIASDSWNIWPNPSNGVLHFSLPQSGEIELSDLAGKIVLSQHVEQNGTVLLQDISNGNYLLKFRSETNVGVKQITIR